MAATKRFDYRTKYKNMSVSQLESRLEYLWDRWTKDITGEDWKLERELNYARRKLAALQPKSA